MLVFMLLFTSSKMPLIKGDIYIYTMKIQFVIKVPLQNYETSSAWFFVVWYSQRIILPCEYNYGLDCDWPGRVFNISKCSEGLFPLVLLNICVLSLWILLIPHVHRSWPDCYMDVADNFDSAIFGFNEYMLERLYSLTEDIQCAELQYIFIFLNKMPMIVLWLKIDRFFKFILFDRHL